MTSYALIDLEMFSTEVVHFSSSCQPLHRRIERIQILDNFGCSSEHPKIKTFATIASDGF